MKTRAVHRYRVSVNHSWSVWLVDEETGTLCVFGDLGTWSHMWGHCGREPEAASDFRLELLRFDEDYIGRKLRIGCAIGLDGRKTEGELRAFILQRRRAREIEKDDARNAYNEAYGVDNETGLTRFADTYVFVRDALLEGFLELTYDVHEAHWLERLMNEHWPLVREKMQKEVADG